ncbi:DNA mismatch repair protein MutT [Anaeromyxobacter sp. Fw109-5]|uniref:dipeptidyl-peptidase 3 family protein n=1 Tax=Anaeromyxobacter sp. (strain Fw109-5) TaxID=404589 RepID=UPI000158A515|nr:DNA mismatch repair protein MutT [Anaeromyxobacter sp. Fw109-5]ABS24742.1 MutT/NUDIX family protein [Anaeromyxobacter sp. Fw109-5]
MRIFARSLAAALAFAALPADAASAARFPDAAALRRAEARYAPVDLKVDVSRLPESERRALALLVEAARVMDALFLRQAWAGNEPLLLVLAQDRSPLGQARLAAFLRNKGPWDRLEHGEPAFLPGVPEKPAAANFYPAGATKEEVERWLAGLAPEAKAEATGFFTTVRRAPGGGLVAVPYALEYQGDLARAAELLRAAAAATSDATLRKFLEARAQAFTSNDYYASDVAWMELDASVEPTIGPYEVYEDGWFNAKAAFEAFIGVRDDAETAKLQRFAAELQGIEDALPIDAALKNPKLGAMAPIRVVNELLAAGDAMKGVQTAAFNLPNDERIVREMGSKRVMLKNVQEAKFQRVLLPIAGIALSKADRAAVAFDPFFTHILMHELLHGLGPHELVLGGRTTTVRAELGDTYSALEEAKADVAGLFALQKLLDEGKLDRGMQRTLYPTFLASAFRSIRFGVGEAHGRGMALQLSWFLDAGAIAPRPDGSFAIDAAKMREAVVSLTREIMTIQGKGDRAAAQALLEQKGVVRPEVQRVLDRLRGIPVDIAPRFVTAEALTQR